MHGSVEDTKLSTNKQHSLSGEATENHYHNLCAVSGARSPRNSLKWLSLSMEKTAPHGAPRRDIRSPWRQLLSLPIPCHAHWPRSYCQSPAHPPAICGKPCFRGRSGCMRGAGAFGPFLRAGCAGAAWVRGGSLGSGMRAGRRCLAPQVGGVRCSCGLLSSDADTRARCADGLVAGWGRCVFQQFWVGHASALGLVRSPVAISVLLRWSPSGAYHG